MCWYSHISGEMFLESEGSPITVFKSSLLHKISINIDIVIIKKLNIDIVVKKN